MSKGKAEEPSRIYTLPERGSIPFKALVELEKHVGWTAVAVSRLDRHTGGAGASVVRNALQAMDDHALLNHLDRVWRWLGVVRRKGVLDKTFGPSLRAMSEDITFLRNKRQHSEEYLDPEKARPNYAAERFGNAILMTPPEWSSTIAGVRKLGGRLIVSDVSPALAELHHQLVDAGLWVLPWSPDQLAQADHAGT